MFIFYCAALLWYNVSHTLLYTNPVTLYYSENICTNQGATITSDAQAVNACTCASISEPTSSLIKILLNKKTEPEQRVTCVCSGKQSVNVTILKHFRNAPLTKLFVSS